MFLDEARLVAKLSHPNIAQLYDIGFDGDSYYLVIEYIKGVNLADIIDNYNGALPYEFSIPVIYGVCEALNYIHNLTDEYGNPLNVVHRDVNPQNVLISYTGAVKLIDFGIAKAKTHVYETRTGIIKGTYGYMAPEQITKKIPIGPYTDLFAVGIMLYEMTTGYHPFNAQTEMEIFKKILNAHYVKPSQIIKDYPKELESLIVQLLSINPVDRPLSAFEIQEVLEQFMFKRGIFYSTSRIAKVLSKIIKGESVEGKNYLISSNKFISEKLDAKAKTKDSSYEDLETVIIRGSKRKRERRSKYLILIGIVIFLSILILAYFFSWLFNSYLFSSD